MSISGLPLINIAQGERLAIAFSGGGDSAALLHMLKEHSPKPRVFIVDHNLRPGSALEARNAKTCAQSMGFGTEILSWQNESPTSGIQEKARKARYALLGEACRRANITHLVTGHTQDDQAETLLMRYDRGTNWRGAAGMRQSTKAPIWPALAGLTLLRPLLHMTRAELRAYNVEHGLTWTEDPSNENRDFTRIRARDMLRTDTELRSLLLECAKDLQAGRDFEDAHFWHVYRRQVKVGMQGIIHLRSAIPAPLLSRLLRAASGTGGPISRDKLFALKQLIDKPNFTGTTLGGAHIVPAPQGGVWIGPDPATVTGGSNRAGIKPQKWPAFQKQLWAGRFWISTMHEDATVQPLSGHITRLPKIFAETVKAVPAPFRGSLPLITNSRGGVLGVGEHCLGVALYASSVVVSRLHDGFDKL